MKVKKDGVVKEINSEALLADYICAGWNKVEEKKTSRFERLERLEREDK